METITVTIPGTLHAFLCRIAGENETSLEEVTTGCIITLVEGLDPQDATVMSVAVERGRS